MMRSFIQKRKYMLAFLACIAVFVSILLGCKKDGYDNPYDSSVSGSTWAPNNLSIAQTSLKSVQLKWDQTEKRIDSFCIEVKRGQEEWKVIGYSGKNTPSFIDTTINPDPNELQTYRVHALAWKNNSSTISKIFKPTFFKPWTPYVTKALGIKVKVFWMDNYTGEDNFKVEKKVEGGNWVLCADTIRANSTYFYDTAPELNTQILYRLSARARGIYSDTSQSNKISTVIAPPTWLILLGLSQTSCRVEWKQGEIWTTGYNVDRQFGNSPWQDAWMKLDSAKTTFTDSNLPIDQDIKYRVSTIVNNSLSTKVELIYGLAVMDSISTSNFTYSSVNVATIVKSETGSTVTEWGIVYGTSPNPTVADTKVTATTAGNIRFATTLTGLDNSKTYYMRPYSINTRGESYGIQKIFHSNPYLVPLLDVTIMDRVLQTRVEVSSIIKNDGGQSIIESGFVCSENPGPTINDIKAKKYTTGDLNLLSGAFDNLLYVHSYYVRSYATNSVGVGYGPEKTIKTISYGLPVIDTLSIKNVDATKVQLNSFLRNNGEDYNTKRGFVWGTSINPTIADNIWTDISQYSGYTNPYSWYLTNLTANQTLHIRAYAQNLAGVVYSPEKVITTLNISTPVVDAPNVTMLGFTTTTLNSMVSRDGGNVILEAGFLYSITPDPTINDNKVICTVNAPDYTLSYMLNSLIDNQKYYVRSYARYSLGTVFSPVVAFTTRLIYPAQVDVMQAYKVYPTSAYVFSYVVTNGGSTLSDNGFVYGDNPGPTLADNKVVVEYGRTVGSYHTTLTNLLPDHQYYVRSYVKNLKGVAYSPDVIFTTKSITPPILDIITVRNIMATAIDLSSFIISDGGNTLTESGFVYSTITGPTINDNKVVFSGSPIDTGGYNMTGNLTGLTREQTYYIRSFATTPIGTGYGPEIVVKTLP